MSNQEVLIRLRELHEELTAINQDLNAPGQIDDETVEALGQLVTDVGQLVDRAQEAMDPVEPPHDLREELIDRITEFECQHPRVARLLSQVTDVLAMIGI